MKFFLDSTHLKRRVAAGSFVIAAAMIAPQTLAHSVDERVKQLENQLRVIQNQLNQIKAESKKDLEQATQAKDTAIQARDTAIQAKDKAVAATEQANLAVSRGDRQDRKSRMLFFRGGFAHAAQGRNGVTLQSNVAPLGAQEQGDKDAWYVGAGIDWRLTRDVWGVMSRTDVFAELMFEYKRFGGQQGNVLANSPTQLAGPVIGATVADNPRNVTVSQFTLTAAPKIKFLEGSKLRPWIIPAGLAIHVISPPSESITVLTPGVMFAAGADYNIWKDFYVGLDARYHVTGGKHDGVNVDGLTAGGYLGIGF
ncbi:MAG: porin family protein [Betaproteobacteria bacterium]|nr:porin family protein [Betaproteobacteria bacterium]